MPFCPENELKCIFAMFMVACGKMAVINHFMLKTFICFKNSKIFYFVYLKSSLLKIDHCALQISHGTIYFRFYRQLAEFI